MTSSAGSPPEYVIDPDTLRETVTDIAAVTSHIADLKASGETGDAERVSWLRIVGRLAEAEELGWHMLIDRGGANQHHTVTEPLPFAAVSAALRLAHVLHWQKDFNTAEALFDAAFDSADIAAKNGTESSTLAHILIAFTWQHRGKLRYDQGRFTDARDCFTRALNIRESLSRPTDELESSRLAIKAATTRLNQTD